MGRSQVTRGLFVGSAADAVNDVGGVDVLVLCAEEFQPAEGTGVPIVLHAPMDDAPMTPKIARAACGAADEVAKYLRGGACVLVTCFLGFNRSGLVAALALKRCGLSPGAAVEAVRRARGPSALSNRSFERFVYDETRTSQAWDSAEAVWR
jgi:protein-tyrosine phosphatase